LRFYGGRHTRRPPLYKIAVWAAGRGGWRYFGGGRRELLAPLPNREGAGMPQRRDEEKHTGGGDGNGAVHLKAFLGLFDDRERGAIRPKVLKLDSKHFAMKGRLFGMLTIGDTVLVGEAGDAHNLIWEVLIVKPADFADGTVHVVEIDAHKADVIVEVAMVTKKINEAGVGLFPFSAVKPAISFVDDKEAALLRRERLIMRVGVRNSEIALEVSLALDLVIVELRD